MVRDRLLAPYRKQLEERMDEDELAVALLEGRDTPSSGLVAVFLMMVRTARPTDRLPASATMAPTRPCRATGTDQ